MREVLLALYYYHGYLFALCAPPLHCFYMAVIHKVEQRCVSNPSQIEILIIMSSTVMRGYEMLESLTRLVYLLIEFQTH
jgi:hypothetical protein